MSSSYILTHLLVMTAMLLLQACRITTNTSHRARNLVTEKLEMLPNFFIQKHWLGRKNPPDGNV
jgi:hypothetical protein